MSAIWLWPYLVGLAVISYLSSFDFKSQDIVPLVGLKGPINALSFGWDMLAMVVFSLAICLLAVRQRLPREKVEEYIGDLTAEADPAVG